MAGEPAEPLVGARIAFRRLAASALSMAVRATVVAVVRCCRYVGSVRSPLRDRGGLVGFDPTDEDERRSQHDAADAHGTDEDAHQQRSEAEHSDRHRSFDHHGQPAAEPLRTAALRVRQKVWRRPGRRTVGRAARLDQ
jgi:hypothetical protein